MIVNRPVIVIGAGGHARVLISSLKALQREIMEELAIEIQVGKEIGAYKHAYTHFSVLVHAFDCQRKSGRLKACEAQQITWVKPAEFSDYPMGKVDRLIARQVIKNWSGTV